MGEAVPQSVECAERRRLLGVEVTERKGQPYALLESHAPAQLVGSLQAQADELQQHRLNHNVRAHNHAEIVLSVERVEKLPVGWMCVAEAHAPSPSAAHRARTRGRW